MDLRGAFDAPVETIVLAENEFGAPGGKTANGVVTDSAVFDVRAVVDSTQAGSTVGRVLEAVSTDEASTDTTATDEPVDDEASDVPIVDSVAAALEAAPTASVLVIGVAPAGGELPAAWVDEIRTAIAAGCDVVSGLHTFLGDDPTWRESADDNDVRLFDVRKPPDETELRVGDGSVDAIDAPVVLTTGTDCAVGKRTTAVALYRAATRAGIDAGWVATGQTGIMVGAHRGVVIDRVPADFAAGVVEDLVVDAAADHDLVIVEGQASLTHRAYSGVTLSILHGAWPDAVVIADDPERERRTHFEQFPVAGLERDRTAIEQLSDAIVAAVSTWGDPERVRAETGLPAANVTHEHGADRLWSYVERALDDTA